MAKKPSKSKKMSIGFNIREPKIVRFVRESLTKDWDPQIIKAGLREDRSKKKARSR